MADISITAASVAKTSNTVTSKVGYAGEALTAGQAVYQRAADDLYLKAQADGTLAESRVVGVALNTAASGQPVVVGTGNVTIGGTVTVGQVYAVSAAAGGIAPIDDLVTGNYVSILGYGISSSQIKVEPRPLEVQLA